MTSLGTEGEVVRDAEIRVLFRARPRNRAVRWTAVAFAALGGYAWWGGSFRLDALVAERAQRNLARFLTEVRPHPLQGREWDWNVAQAWLVETLAGRAGEAVTITLCVSVASIVLAALLAAVSSLAASRALATPEPFLPAARRPAPLARLGFAGLTRATRLLLILLRAVPEYVWAFLLLTLLGLGAWPAVLALALHNGGILGKLFAEVVEDAEPRPSRALRGLGASRLSIATTSILSESLGRFLLFFFYRWETCVREATVLGLLGFSGLGFLIVHAYAAMRYDEMVVFVLLGSVVILAGDGVSAVARAWIRNAP